MRTARLTWEGAYHHVMNRGLNKMDIFADSIMKSKYLELMAELSEKFKIRIFSYCIMNNHFHMALENTSAQLSDFMKNLNGRYGRFYRKITQSKGYVFEDRYKSILIQNEKYLTILICYILFNPVRSGFVDNPLEYKWSSASHYYGAGCNSFLDRSFVEELFGTKQMFFNFLIQQRTNKLKEMNSDFGRLFGEEKFKKVIENKKIIQPEVNVEELLLRDSIKNIVQDFEKEHSISISDINVHQKSGKELRRKLLFKLKNISDLKYSDIVKINLFRDLKTGTIRKMYWDIKKRS